MANSKPDLVNQVIQHLLPRYREGRVEFAKEYDDDVRRIVKAFHTASADRQRELVRQLKISWQVPCRASGGFVHSVPPEDSLYFPTAQLQNLYHDLTGVHLIDQDRGSVCGDQCRAVLAACGVQTHLRTLLWSSPETDLNDVRRQLGWKKTEVDLLYDFQIDHLDQILHRISQGEPKWENRSLALWDCLHDALRYLGEDFFYGRYEAWNTKRTTRAARFPAYFVRVLRRTAWLPTRGDTPKSPRELSLADLPARFRQTARPFILQLLQFKRNVGKPSSKADFVTVEIPDKPDLVDEVVDHVLPRYREPAFELPPNYGEDVRKIVRAFHAATPDRRKELVGRLSEARWAARKFHRSDRTLLQSPWGLYLPSKKLQKLFDGLRGIMFIDPRQRSLRGAKASAVLEACGAASRLACEWGAQLSDDELSEIRQQTGWGSTEGEWVDDYSMHDLEKVLESISKSEAGWQDRSFALWDCLHDVLRHSGGDFFWGKYEAWDVKRKRMLRAARFPASFVRKLQRAAWLPAGEGQPQRPCELSLADLPAKFRRGASKLLVHLLGFKTGTAQPSDANCVIALEILEGSETPPTSKPAKREKRKKTASGTRKKRARR